MATYTSAQLAAAIKAADAAGDANAVKALIPQYKSVLASEQATSPEPSTSPDASVGPDLGRLADQAGNAIVHGAEGVLSLPGNLLQMGVDALGLQGLEQPSTFDPVKGFVPVPGATPYNPLPTSDTLAATGDRLGMTDDSGALAPKNDLETGVTDVGEGVGAALPFMAGGPLAALLMGVGSGGGKFVANKVAPGNPWADFFGSMVGGLGTGEVTKVAEGIAARSAIAKLSPAQTTQDAGTALQADAQNWYDNKLPKAVQDAWAPVDSAVPPDTPVTLTNYGDTLSNLVPKLGPLTKSGAVVSPGTVNTMQQLAKEFASITDPTWGDLQHFRSLLGEGLANPKIMPTVKQTDLKALYASITADMKEAADANGVGDAFDAANAETSRLYGIAEGPVAKILGKNPEATVGPLLGAGKKGATDLAALREVAPDGANALAKTAATSGAWAKMAPEAKDALIPDKGLQGYLDRASAPKASALTTNTVRGFIGGGALTPILSMFGLPTEALTNSEVGAALALGLPAAARAVKGVWQDPMALRAPIIGLGASNVLAGTGQ